WIDLNYYKTYCCQLLPAALLPAALLPAALLPAALLPAALLPAARRVRPVPASAVSPECRSHGIVELIAMTLTIELEQEDDGRWIAEIPELPGVLVYGDTQAKAAQLARALAFRVLADQIESGELDASTLATISFAA